MFYRLKFDSVLSFINMADYALLKIWKNPAPIDEWKILKLTCQSDVSHQHVMGLHNIMVWQMEVLEMLTPLLGTAIQALPVTIDGVDHVAIHVTHTIDCLDEIHSQFKRFKNRNIGVEHYVLRADCVGDANLFAIPDDGYSAIFVSAHLKEQFEQHQWQGLSFIPIETQ